MNDNIVADVIKDIENNITTPNITNQVNLQIRVRYGECDAQQVVFNARYADYADLAATEYIRALIGQHQHLIDAGYDNQVVSLHIDWFASAAFDDVLNLAVHVGHIGNTSFQLVTQCSRINNEGKLEPIANMKTTYVIVDASTFTKAKIPPLLLENFARSFSVSVDQAG
ncbi:MAG: acyl-CoA thioester hydrolase [Alphaproteobacteria bacterium]|jgi:acyl-CoA thioester hydrolase